MSRNCLDIYNFFLKWLHREIIQKPKHEVINWKEIVAPNRDRASSVALEFIAPIEKDGVKIVKFKESEELEEIQKW